jgi:HEAT repeat protein
LVQLGNYHGEALLREALASEDAAIRRTALRGLGEMGAKTRLRALLALYRDADRTVQVAAAAAVLVILGLEPRVLAEAAVDWTRSAIDADDWTVRHAAARSLGDIAEEKAVPLLARAVVDPDPRVRQAAAESAARMTTVAAAEPVAAALTTESVTEVREAQVRALGHMGKAVAKPALEAVATDKNRVGVLAFGSLIAVGDESYATRLGQAYERGSQAIREAVMEAAVLANNRIVVPTLENGLGDAVARVRFLAAEGMAHYRVTDKRAVTILEKRLLAEPTMELRSRALRGLLQLDIQPPASISVVELATAPEPEVQRAALPVLEVMDFAEAEPFLRQMSMSPDPEVRSGVVDVIRKHAKEHEDTTAWLLKGMLKDNDPLTRTKAKAQFAKIAPPILPQAKKDEKEESARGPVNLSEVEEKLAAVQAVRAEFDALHAKVAKMVDEIGQQTGKRATSEGDIDRINTLGSEVMKLHKKLLQVHGRMAAAAAEVAEAAKGLGPEAEALAAAAQASAQESSAASLATGQKAGAAAGAVKRYMETETANCELYLTAAEAAIPAGRLPDARRDLEKAERICNAKSQTGARLQYLFGWYHDTVADNAAKAQTRLRNLKKAKMRYENYVKVGSGFRLEQAKERLKEIDADQGEN